MIGLGVFTGWLKSTSKNSIVTYRRSRTAPEIKNRGSELT
nr:hypothetical protein [Providencia sp.]UNJ80177.1 hypothetical protein [Providencia sp.]